MEVKGKELDKYLALNLKLFYIEDGESYYILAKDEESARDYYENSGACLDNDLKEDILEDCESDNIRDCYTIKEITIDMKQELDISEDEELIKLINKHKPLEKKTTSINVILYIKYSIIEAILQDKELEIPTLIGGTVCSCY